LISFFPFFLPLFLHYSFPLLPLWPSQLAVLPFPPFSAADVQYEPVPFAEPFSELLEPIFFFAPVPTTSNPPWPRDWTLVFFFLLFPCQHAGRLKLIPLPPGAGPSISSFPSSNPGLFYPSNHLVQPVAQSFPNPEHLRLFFFSTSVSDNLLFQLFPFFDNPPMIIFVIVLRRSPLAPCFE